MKQSKLLKITRKTHGRCFYCNGPGEEVDHWISKKEWKEFGLEKYIPGGLDDIQNLFLTCKKCNRSKRDKHPEEFMNSPYDAWNRHKRANQRIGINSAGWFI